MILPIVFAAYVALALWLRPAPPQGPAGPVGRAVVRPDGTVGPQAPGTPVALAVASVVAEVPRPAPPPVIDGLRFTPEWLPEKVVPLPPGLDSRI